VWLWAPGNPRPLIAETLPGFECGEIYGEIVETAGGVGGLLDP